MVFSGAVAAARTWRCARCPVQTADTGRAELQSAEWLGQVRDDKSDSQDAVNCVGVTPSATGH